MDTVPSHNDKPMLKPHEAAGLLHVTPRTLNNWARDGRLGFIRTIGGHRRYATADVMELVRTMHVPMQRTSPEQVS